MESSKSLYLNQATPAIIKFMVGTPLERVLSRKEELGISDAEFARLLGLSHQAFFSWKRRGSVPARHLAKAAQILKTTTDWIQTGAVRSGVDVSVLANVMRVVGEIERDSQAMDPADRAELVALLYEDAIKDPSSATYDRIMRFIKMLRRS